MAPALIQGNTMKTRAGQSLSILFRFSVMYLLFLLSQFDEALPLQQIMSGVNKELHHYEQNLM